jgi:nucleotide-binding universal stress UspA family protein
MKTILAPIDFSPVSRRVISAATSLAAALDGRVILMHTVKPPTIVTDLAPAVGEAVQIANELEQAAHRHLLSLGKRLAKRGVNVEIVCQQGYPLANILAQAKALPADFIVIGSHGHTAFYDLVLGSTSSGVLKRATCPVVVVPAARKTKGRTTGARRVRRRSVRGSALARK